MTLKTDVEALKADIAAIKEILGIAPAQLQALEAEFQTAMQPAMYSAAQIAGEVGLGPMAVYSILNAKGCMGPEYVTKRLTVMGVGRAPEHQMFYTEKARQVVIEEAQKRLARKKLKLTKAQSDVFVEAQRRGLSTTTPILLSPDDLAEDGVARGKGAMGKVINYLIQKGVFTELSKHDHEIKGRGKYLLQGSTPVELHPSAPALKESKRRAGAA